MSKLYNDQQKQMYLTFEKLNTKSLMRYFKRIAKKEEEYSKDICKMQLDELVDTFKSLKIQRISSRRHVLSLLRGYVDWVKFNGVKDCQPFIHLITPEGTSDNDSIINTMIKNPTHLQEIIDDGLDFINYENRSKIIMLLLKLLYIGVTLDEMCYLQKSDIYYNTNIIKTSKGRTFFADKSLAALWKECADITYIEKKNGRAAVSKSKTTNEYARCFLHDSNYLFRSVAGKKANTVAPYSINQFRKLIAEPFIAIDKKVVPARNLNSSGAFYRVYLLQKGGNKLTPELIADVMNIKHSSREELLVKTGAWRVDYEDWQIAFGYK